METNKMDFKGACVYQIYPKSFKDTTGSGFGDLNGVTEKLDYLKELGVEYLWLTSFFVSPQNDNGYDIQDYYKIDPLFGTMEDLERLIAEGKKRGISLMLDMVLNHTSIYHEWFQKALNGEKAYQDYYFFREGKKGVPPTNWISKFGGNAWEYVEHLGKYYLHLFDKTQADLNWDNPMVREEVKKIVGFWKDKGIRGFRFDVINLISKPSVLEDDNEGDGRRFYTDGPNVHKYLQEVITETGLDVDEFVTVGEMSSTTIEHCLQYTKPEEKQLKMCFNFHHLKVDYRDGDKWSLMPYDFEKLKELFHTWQTGMDQGNGWNAVFWCNHDQPRTVSRYTNDQEYLCQSAKMLATCIHGMRGTPYIYQGEEIGMTNAYFTSISQYRDVESLHYFEILKERGMGEEEVYEVLRQRSRDNSRTPMQWSGESEAGFTDGTPWISVNQNYTKINAEENRKDPDSIFYYYQKLIRLRKEYRVIREGNYEPLLTKAGSVFGYRRSLGTETLIVLTNFSDQEQIADVGIDVGAYQQLIGNNTLTRSECKAPGSHQSGAEKTGVRLKPFEAVMLYYKQPVE